jgi:hypothetical protein
VSPKGHPVRCRGWAMNAILDFDRNALAELISRRWQEDRPHLTLNRTACGAWVENSWGRKPANGALKLHRSRRSPAPPERPLRSSGSAFKKSRLGGGSGFSWLERARSLLRRGPGQVVRMV